jgi:hypothetical protein
MRKEMLHLLFARYPDLSRLYAGKAFLPGDPEPLWIRQRAEFARLRREDRAARRASAPRREIGRPWFFARLRTAGDRE